MPDVPEPEVRLLAPGGDGPGADVLGRDVPQRRPAPAWLSRPPRAVVAGLAAAAVAVAAAGGVAAAALDVPSPVAAAPQVGVVFAGGTSSVDGAAVTGVLALLVVNRSAAPVVVVGPQVAAPGLLVTGVGPQRQPPLPALGQRRYVVRYLVPDCAALRLPGTVRVELAGGGRAATRVAVLADPTGGPADVPFAPCPASALPEPAVGVQARGGTSERSGAGARGRVVVDVRNGGEVPLRLLALTAEVPGVRFSPLVPPNGLTLVTDERVELVLGFEVPDCARLRRTGRLVLRVQQAGVTRELGLPVTNDREAGTLRRASLDVVLRACPR